MPVFETVAHVEFPVADDREVNMMPFIIGDPESLPSGLRAYQAMIDACGVEEEQAGRVGYLTVMETLVCHGASQRRGGVHVERHPDGRWGGGGWGSGSRSSAGRRGGLYIASSVARSTAVWDFEVDQPGPGGDCAHLQGRLADPDRILDAGELVWMTDRCPHESLPVDGPVHRQFFRLVTSEVDLWFAANSTANPLGVMPPRHVRVIEEDKFA